MPADFFCFRENFQDLVLACMMRKEKRFARVIRCMRAKCFTGVQPALVAKCMLAHFERYKRMPSWESLEQRIDEAIRQLPETKDSLAIDYVRKLRQMDVGDCEFVRNHVAAFLVERTLVDAIRRVIDMVQENTVPFDRIAVVFAETLKDVKALKRLGYPAATRFLPRCLRRIIFPFCPSS